MMNRIRYNVKLICLVGLFTLAACDSGPGESLYDPDVQLAPDPVISSIEPQGVALAGVDVLTITGENFSSNPEHVNVYFDGEPGEVLEASPTQVRVRPPNTPNPALGVRVSVVGAESFSNTVDYALEAALETFGDITAFEAPFAIATNADGTLYVSLFRDNISVGIKKITPDGVRSDFSDSRFKWDDFALGPDGFLYAVRNIRASFRFPPEGGDQETFGVVDDASTNLRALAFDADGNLWAGGENANLYRIDATGTVMPFAFEADVRSLLVDGGALYAGALMDGQARIYRFSLNAGGLGAGEVYAELPEPYVTAAPQALALAATGDLYIGTSAVVDPVVVVQNDGSVAPLYPGIITAPVLSFAWSPEAWLYATTEATDQQQANLVRINTRSEKAP